MPAQGPASLRRNAAANVAGRLVSAGLWLAVTPFALRHLGPERFGIWSLFFVFGGYVSSLDLGMSQSVARFVAVGVARGDGGMVATVLRRSLWVGGAMGLLWCAAFAFLRPLFLSAFHVPAAITPEVDRSLVVFALSMFAFSVTQVLHGALQGAQRLDLSNAYVLAGLGLHATVLIAGLARGHGLMAAAVAMVSGHVLSGLLASRSVRAILAHLPRLATAGSAGWRELMGFGGVVQATNAFAAGWLQIGKVLLGALGSVVWVTTFELGFRVALAVLSVPQLIQGAVIPAAARASAGEGGDVKSVYLWACRWVFTLGGLMLGGLALAGPALITAWLGPGHDDSGKIARLLAVMFLFIIVPGPATAIARGAGMPGLEAAAFGTAFALEILACVLLIPRFGPAGAAVAMGVSIAAGGLLALVPVHRRLRVATGEWLMRLMAPRVVVPVGVAAALAATGLGGQPASRPEAFGALALQAAAFLPLVLLLTWGTGDARQAFGLLRARLAGGAPVKPAGGAA